jgi:pimeloyl-ACP methyl ester carboxylesterase
MRPEANASVRRVGRIVAVLGSVALATGLRAQTPLPASFGMAVSRVPVLLVPGWGDDAADLALFRERLVAGGWSQDSVLSLTFSDPFGSNEAGSREVARAVDQLGGETGFAHVDIVAHSMGGLAVRRYLLSGTGSVAVRRVVFLGTPHRGTLTASMAWGEGGREMFPGSDFLDRLNGARGMARAVEMLSVRTPVDLRIIPSSSAMLPGAYNVEICCPSHRGLREDLETFEAVRRFLMHGPERVLLPDATIPLETVPEGWENAGWNR